MVQLSLMQELLSRSENFLGAIPVSFTALMPCVNPLGTAIILSSLTSSADDALRRQLARRICLNTAVLLVGSMLIGSHLLAFFGVSVPIVQAVGGFVLASMGWQMLNKVDSADDHDNSSAAVSSDASLWSSVFYPFTFPITIGPGCIAVAITLSAHSQRDDVFETAMVQAGDMIGILIVSLILYLSYRYSTFVTRKLGPSGTAVMMRLISFLVVCIGAQISWEGVSALIRQLS